MDHVVHSTSSTLYSRLTTAYDDPFRMYNLHLSAQA